MPETIRDLVVLTNEAKQVMFVAVEAWGGPTGEALPASLVLTAGKDGVLVASDVGQPLGLAAADAEPALRNALLDPVGNPHGFFLGRVEGGVVVTDREVAVAFT